MQVIYGVSVVSAKLATLNQLHTFWDQLSLDASTKVVCLSGKYGVIQLLNREKGS